MYALKSAVALIDVHLFACVHIQEPVVVNVNRLHHHAYAVALHAIEGVHGSVFLEFAIALVHNALIRAVARLVVVVAVNIGQTVHVGIEHEASLRGSVRESEHRLLHVVPVGVGKEALMVHHLHGALLQVIEQLAIDRHRRAERIGHILAAIGNKQWQHLYLLQR